VERAFSRGSKLDGSDSRDPQVEAAVAAKAGSKSK